MGRAEAVGVMDLGRFIRVPGKTKACWILKSHPSTLLPLPTTTATATTTTATLLCLTVLVLSCTRTLLGTVLGSVPQYRNQSILEDCDERFSALLKLIILFFDFNMLDVNHAILYKLNQLPFGSRKL